jgi:hypothetical protein
VQSSLGCSDGRNGRRHRVDLEECGVGQTRVAALRQRAGSPSTTGGSGRPAPRLNWGPASALTSPWAHGCAPLEETPCEDVQTGTELRLANTLLAARDEPMTVAAARGSQTTSTSCRYRGHGRPGRVSRRALGVRRPLPGPRHHRSRSPRAGAPNGGRRIRQRRRIGVPRSRSQPRPARRAAPPEAPSRPLRRARSSRPFRRTCSAQRGPCRSSSARRS